MTITAILKGHIDQHGFQPIYIRVTNNNKRKHTCTNIRVKPSWFEKGKVKSVCPDYKDYNIKISALIYQTQTLITTPKKEYQEVCFFKFVKDQAHAKSFELSEATINNYTSLRNKVKAYQAILNLSDITIEWLEKFQLYLYDVKGNKQNTVRQVLSGVAQMVGIAHKKKMIEENPFDGFTLPKHLDKEEVPHLTKEEIARLFNFAMNGAVEVSALVAQKNKFANQHKQTTLEDYKQAATWFSIGCLSALRFRDMKDWNKSKIIDGGTRMVIVTHKTKKPVSIPLSNTLKALLANVNFQPLNLPNSDYDRRLLTIAKCLGIRHLNAHLSRHTAAMTWAAKGLPIEDACALMGHKKITTTSIYYKVLPSRTDAALMALDADDYTTPLPIPAALRIAK